MSALGRWTSVDPILGEFGPKTLLEQSRRLLSASPYDYTFGNPVNLIDPTGRSPEDWFQDKDGSFQYAETVKWQADLGEGQTHLGEQVLVKNGDNTEFLSADGSRGYVFDREMTTQEGLGTGAAGFSAAMAKQGVTLQEVKSGGKALEGLKSTTRALGRTSTVTALGFSLSSELAEAANGSLDPLGTYEAVKIGYDMAVAGGSFFGGPVAGPIVAGGGFLLEVTGGKEAIVRRATTEILSLQADRILDLE